MLLLAYAIAVLHGTAIAFMVIGGVLALRWPRLLWLHVPVSLVILGLHLAGSDCPLTTLELHLRARAGVPGYSDGWIGHYVLAPVGVDVHSTPAQIGQFTVALVPNLVAYGILVARALRRQVRPVAR